MTNFPDEQDPALSGPFKRQLATADLQLPDNSEVEFEKRRGINNVEIREGLIRCHVSGLAEPVMDSRLRVLRALADAKISIDFLKFTASGMAFVANEGLHDALKNCLATLDVKFSLYSDRCILLIHAANMRDEEGLVARLVSEVIASGSAVDQLGDMHDRLLLVIEKKDAETLRQRTVEKFMEGASS